MCTVDVNALQQFNVHETQNTSTFQLHYPDLYTACNAIGPLDFCLLPPSNRLQSMCSSTIESYFTNILRSNDNITLEDLPVVWDSLLETSDLPWIPLDSTGQYSSPDNINEYYGLQPIPLFKDVCTNASSSLLFGIVNGSFYKTNVSSGLMELQPDVNGNNDAFQSVYLNQDGSLGAVMYSNALYVWQQDQFLNITETNKQYLFCKILQRTNNVATKLIVVCRDRVQQTCTLQVFTNESNLIFQKLFETSFSVADTSMVLWTVVSPNEKETFVAIDDFKSSIGYNVYAMNNEMKTPVLSARWSNIPRLILTPTSDAHWETVSRDTDLNILVYAVNQNVAQMTFINLAKFQSTGTNDNFPGLSLHVKDSLDGSFFCFTNSQFVDGFFVQTAPYAATFEAKIVSGLEAVGKVDWVAPFAFPSQAQKLWYFARDNARTLFFNENTEQTFGTSFVSTFGIFLNQNARVSDFGLPDFDLKPQVTWFFGYEKFPQIVKNGDILYSPHNYYRFVIQTDIVRLPQQFPHVVTQLQRANFAVLVKQNAVRIFNNSQTTIVDPSSSATIFQRNTNDTWNSNTSFKQVEGQLFESDSKIVSQNGVYILFTPRASTGRGPRVAINIFNCASFFQYCSEHSRETFAQALSQQSTFCWNELFHTLPESEKNVSIDELFDDPRCACISGRRLIQYLYPALNPNFDMERDKSYPNTHAAVLNLNFPCVSKTCQMAILTPESTNAYRFTQETCQDAPLSVCSSLLDIIGTNPQINIAQGFILQQCQGANVPRCNDVDSKCPLGSSCTNGNCVPNCTQDTDCILGSTCQDGKCLAPPQKSTDSNSSAYITLIVVCSIVVVCIVILLIILLVKKKTK